MERFRLNGTIAEVIRYVIQYEENECPAKIYISTSDELALVKARLDSEGITYTVEPVDASDIEWLDGKSFPGYTEVFEAIRLGHVPEPAFPEYAQAMKGQIDDLDAAFGVLLEAIS